MNRRNLLKNITGLLAFISIGGNIKMTGSKSVYSHNDNENYWKRTYLPGKIWKTIIPITNVDMLASTEQLLVKTGYAFELGDIIEINGIEVTVIQREDAWEFPNHNWLLTIDCADCAQAKELKKMLTYSKETK